MEKKKSFVLAFLLIGAIIILGVILSLVAAGGVLYVMMQGAPPTLSTLPDMVYIPADVTNAMC